MMKNFEHILKIVQVLFQKVMFKKSFLHQFDQIKSIATLQTITFTHQQKRYFLCKNFDQKQRKHI